MTKDSCGSTETDSGEPCQLPACRSDGRCWMHTDGDQPEDIGRPTKLSLERQEQIAGAIENGKSMNSAARMAGVTPQTVYNWLSRGEDETEGVFAEFFERIARAKGHGEDYYFGLAMELAIENGDHRFIASLMKQRYPDSWGDTETGVNSDSPVINIPESVVEKWQRQPNSN